MEKIIILGATGNIGIAVLKNLQGKKAEVFAGVQNEKKIDKVLKYGANPIIVNFADQESLNNALRDMDRVFLVTPIMQNPLQITQNVINAIKLNGLKHFVRSTAAGADSSGKIQMARWAGASEDLIKASEINYTLIRPHTFIQNFINFYIGSIKAQNSFYMPMDGARFAQLDVSDLGEIAAMALTTDDHFGKTYELSGLAYTGSELEQGLSWATGRKISYVAISDEQAHNSMVGNGMPEWIVSAMTELNYIMKMGYTDTYSEDFKNITGKEYRSANEFFETNKSLF